MALEFYDVFQWVLIGILIALSGLFSGLTLGLLSLDKVGLQVRSSLNLRRWAFVLFFVWLNDVLLANTI
jgi:CBS domain containing-hemolysin-like protein